MSDNTTEPKEPKIERGGLTIELGEFSEGDLKGVKFYYPQVKSVAAAVTHFTRAGYPGEDVVVALINSVLSARARNKAKSLVPERDKAAERSAFLAKCGGVLISVDEAAEFQPGEREVTSDLSLMKSQKENIKLAKEFKAKSDAALQAGNAEEAATLREKAKSHMELAQKQWKLLQERVNLESIQL